MAAPPDGKNTGAPTTFSNFNLLPDWESTRKALINKMEFEEDLIVTSNINQEIEDWDSIPFDGYPLLSTLLEASTAKQCGETLVVYVKDLYIKNRLSNSKNIEILKSITNCQFIEFITMEEFYPYTNEITLIRYEDILFNF